jgi:adenylosuccinate synthase
VLSGLDRADGLHALPRRGGRRLRRLPLPPVGPPPRTGEYTELEAWSEDIGECRSEEDLPQAARDYLAYIADFIGVPVALIGVGPGREQTIWTAAGAETLVGRAASLASS